MFAFIKDFWRDVLYELDKSRMESNFFRVRHVPHDGIFTYTTKINYLRARAYSRIFKGEVLWVRYDDPLIPNQ